jgi:group I intron endonuclease
MEEQNKCIYLHRNKINGKCYVGQTKQNPNKRWRNGNGYKGCPAFARAIQKYGWESFEHKILFVNLTKEDADRKEKELITQLNTLTPNGYNVLSGGNSGSIFVNNMFKENINIC